MISFTIDTSVFALPPKNDILDIEYINIQRFISNMYYLQNLEKCPSVTVSYMNYIPKNLVENNFYPRDIGHRIQEIKKYKKLVNCNPDILFFFHEKYKKIIPIRIVDKLSNTEIVKKGKIGIYENIPSRETDPEIRYKNITYSNKIYPYEFGKQLSNSFEIYLGFIGELNSKYASKNSNYIVLAGDFQNISEKIVLCYDQFKESEVNIIGINETINLCQNCKFTNLTEVLKEVTQFNNLMFGTQVNASNVISNMNFENCNEITESDFSNKLYHYLYTLNQIAGRIENLSLTSIEEKVFLINTYGCFCSPDSNIYEKCPIKTRFFMDQEGNSKYFYLHCKPFTYSVKSINNSLTRRIYFNYENNKILIGWIGKHPQSCSNDLNSECVKCSCPNIPKKPLAYDKV